MLRCARQIYNEAIDDLLSPERTNLRLRETNAHDVRQSDAADVPSGAAVYVEVSTPAVPSVPRQYPAVCHPYPVRAPVSAPAVSRQYYYACNIPSVPL